MAASGSKEVGLQARIALFMRPQRVRDSSEVVDQKNGVTVFGEVDGSQIKLASVAGFDAHMRRILADVYGQFVFGFFTAGWAKDSTELPLLRAERAEEEAFSAVALRSQYA